MISKFVITVLFGILITFAVMQNVQAGFGEEGK